MFGVFYRYRAHRSALSHVIKQWWAVTWSVIWYCLCTLFDSLLNLLWFSLGGPLNATVIPCHRLLYLQYSITPCQTNQYSVEIPHNRLVSLAVLCLFSSVKKAWMDMVSGHADRDTVHNGCSCMTSLFQNWFCLSVFVQVRCRYHGSVLSPQTKCPTTSSKCNFTVSVCVVGANVLFPRQIKSLDQNWAHLLFFKAGRHIAFLPVVQYFYVWSYRYGQMFCAHFLQNTNHRSLSQCCLFTVLEEFIKARWMHRQTKTDKGFAILLTRES